jgi:hypothetical protein
MNTTPLIRKLTSIDDRAFPDVYAAIAKEVEEALITAGAIPGKDYTILDVFRLAQPFALDVCQKKQLEFTLQWPAKNDE